MKLLYLSKVGLGFKSCETLVYSLMGIYRFFFFPPHTLRMFSSYACHTLLNWTAKV